MYLFLVENYDEVIKATYGDDIDIIALNPKSAQDLKNNNLSYKIIEDYFLWEQDEKYFNNEQDAETFAEDWVLNK